jgi:oligopeptide/dipeptide ABC transporter ATP-binding protein
MSQTDIVLQINNLKTEFTLDEGVLHAVDGVSLTIPRHRAVGVIGESGCGKSVMAQSILQIVPKPGRITEGEILLHQNGEAPLDLGAQDPYGRTMRAVRGGVISMIFQEPLSSLSPVHTIGDQISEMILEHQTGNPRKANQRALNMLRQVEISNAEQRMHEYPHQLSGGLRQRVMIAMALACRPQLLIADEPTTALDVTVQAKILMLMKQLQQQFGMAILFITHDLGVIAGMVDVVTVMYLGQVMEQAPVREIFNHPLHPYTVGLMQSAPRMGMGRKRLQAIEGMVPVPINLPDVCRFMDRCGQARAGLCDRRIPPLIEIKKNHFVRCALYEEGGDA